MSSHAEHAAIDTVERVSSSLSVLGAIFIIATYLSNINFRKPINRLVFYAAWGNLFVNTATMIARSGIHFGEDAPLCQIQAFMIQWFMPADVMWTFMMAMNVYLTFFWRFNAEELRKMETVYLWSAYGIPFVPAFTYLFINTHSRGKMYGSAYLWCWINPNWSIMRLATFYIPVWCLILTIIAIYVRVGAVILKWRKELSSFAMSQQQPQSTAQSGAPSHAVPQARHEREELTSTNQVPRTSILSNYSYIPPPSPVRTQFLPISPVPSGFPSLNNNLTALPATAHTVVQPKSSISLRTNKAAMAYCKTALLFFIAQICTWVPSTVNRVYSQVSGKPSPFALAFVASLVLPLQGFWNTVIYVATSREACQALLNRIRGRTPSISISRCGSMVAPIDQRPIGSLGSASSRTACASIASTKKNSSAGQYGVSEHQITRNHSNGSADTLFGFEDML